MKKKVKKKYKWIWVLGSVVLLGLVFFNSPKKLLKIDIKDVVKITIFNGNTGDKIDIVNRATINDIISNLNSVTIQRKSWALGHMGYRYKIELLGKKSKLKTFIVNSGTVVRKDLYYYDVVKGDIDIDYIASLFANE